MDSKTITQLPDATTPYDGTEEFAMWQGGTTVKGTLPISSNPKIVNLRDYGVTTATEAFWNSRQIEAAMDDVGAGGTVVVPNYGFAQLIPCTGIVMREGITLTGEAPAEQSTYYAYGFGGLTCTDSTVACISINGDSGFGTNNITISNMAVKGGKDNILFTEGLFVFCNLVNLSLGSSRRSALRMQAFRIEECVFKNIVINNAGSTTAGISGAGADCDDTYFAATRFENFWIINGNPGILMDVANHFSNSVDLIFDKVRFGTNQGASIAWRAGLVGASFSSLSCEATCQGLAAGARVDYLFDFTKGASPNNIGCTNARISKSMPANTSYISLLSRNGTIVLDDDGITGWGTPYGVRYDYRGTFAIDGIGSDITYPTDPGTAAYGDLAASVSVMRYFDYYPMSGGCRSSQDLANGMESDVLPGICSANCFAMNDEEDFSVSSLMA